MFSFLKNNQDSFKSKIKNLSILKNKSRFAEVSIISIMCIFVTVVTFNQNFTLALAVSYEDQDMGLVQAKSNVDIATEIVKDKIVVKNKENKENMKIEPNTSLVIAKKEKVISENELANNIIDNSKQIVKGEGLYVDGDLYAAVDEKSNIDETLDNILDEHKTGHEEEQVEFTKDIEVVKGIFLSEEVVDEKTLENKVKKEDPISVSKSYQKVTMEEIPFETEVVKSDKYVVGTKIIEQNGSNGLIEYKEQITTVDNTEKDRFLLREDVVKTPKKQRIIIGTAKVEDKAANLAALNGEAFILPLRGGYISSPYGGRDGEMHKGVDLCIRGGTLGKPVLSTSNGVVEEVLTPEQSGGYGLKITVNHGNNIRSVYAHLDSADVKQGQIVKTGEQLGRAGNTGMSFGAHLHFELYINNQRVNPMDYVKDIDIDKIKENKSTIDKNDINKTDTNKSENA